MSRWKITITIRSAGLLVREQQGEAGLQCHRGGQVVGRGRGSPVHDQGPGSGHQPEDGERQGPGEQGHHPRAVSVDPVRTEGGQQAQVRDLLHARRQGTDDDQERDPVHGTVDQGGEF